MATKPAHTDLPASLSDSASTVLTELTLTPEAFHTFYRLIHGMRFPMNVAEVLELRFLINHAVDRFQEPPNTADYRYFRRALTQAIDSFGVVETRHRERLLKTLAMLRELHYQHSVRSRQRESRLRALHGENREVRNRSVRYGLFFLLSGIGIAIAGIALLEMDWIAKLAAAGCAWLALDFFQSLSVLDREAERFTRELNDTLRTRVREVNWKTLIHKLALLLGYKKVDGIEVFRGTVDGESSDSRLHH